ncbi:MAG: polyphosphate kinase 2 family protein [Thermomicrobiales bacterium]
MGYALRFDGSQPFNLLDISTVGDPDADRSNGEAELDRLTGQIGDLQNLLYAAGTDALLIVLQGMDTSGKDGVIRDVLDDVDPQGVHVWSFKVPTAEERSHDFLWRHHLHTPATSSIAVFNRSYYEAVLVEKVKGIASEAVIKTRYPHINDFELLLTQTRTIVLKFFLYISKEEQAERLVARQKDVAKAWKLSLGDWQERQYWDAYLEAYQQAIAATATTYAPWYVVPSDRKWYRNLAVAQVIAASLETYREQWIAGLQERGDRELAMLREAGYAR